MPPARPPIATALADHGTAGHLAAAAWWDTQREALAVTLGVFAVVAGLLLFGDGARASTLGALAFVVVAFAVAARLVRRAAVARLTATFAGWAPPGTLLASWVDDGAYTLVHGFGELRIGWSQLRSVGVRGDVVVLRPATGRSVVAVPGVLLPEPDRARVRAALAHRAR